MYVGLDISKNEIVSIGMDKEGSLLHKEKYELYTEEIDRLVDTVGKDTCSSNETRKIEKILLAKEEKIRR